MSTNEESKSVSPVSQSVSHHVSPSHTLIDFTTYETAWRSANLISRTDLCPKDCQGKPADIILRVEMGKSLGLSPLQSLSNIASINGRPTVWGDALTALCRQSPLCEYIHESIEEDDKSMRAICKVKRKGEEEQIRIFSNADAVLAELWGKAGPWKKFPKRMLQMRARNWALRDVFADLLGNVGVREETLAEAPTFNGVSYNEDGEILPTTQENDCSSPADFVIAALGLEE